MRNKGGLMSLLAMTGMMLEASALMEMGESRRNVMEHKEPRQIEPKPPTGTKEYFFNTQGEFSTVKMLKTECVFKCFAINDKNAKRKHEKFRKLA